MDTAEHNYAGMIYNPDSGLYLTQFRVYDPAVGRWLSRDPLGDVLGADDNLYQYASSNPVALTDALGLYVDAMGGYYPDGPCPGFDFNPLEHPNITAGMAVGVISGAGVAVAVDTALANAALMGTTAGRISSLSSMLDKRNIGGFRRVIEGLAQTPEGRQELLNINRDASNALANAANGNLDPGQISALQAIAEAAGQLGKGM